MWCEFCKRAVNEGSWCPKTGAAHKPIPTREQVQEETRGERRRREEAEHGKR